MARKKLRKIRADLKRRKWLGPTWKIAVIGAIVLLWNYEHMVTEGVVSFAIVLEKCFDIACGGES